LTAIQDHASHNRIGGTNPGERNVIGGGSYGINVTDYGTVDNQVVGNYIGTDATGTVSLGRSGVWFDGGPSRTLVAGNLISPTNSAGIGLGGDYNVVIGNLIGTDASGKTALGQGGVMTANLTTRRNRIGGTGPGEGNVIGGSGPGTAIWLATPGTESNYVIGNLVGTLPGAGALENMAQMGSTIRIDDGAKRVVVGGSTDAEANLIGGSGNGILASEGVSYTFIGHNWIGASRDGSPALGLRGNGVDIEGADHTFIMGNRIAGSGKAGVWNQIGAATTIRGNAIHDNNSGIVVSISPGPLIPVIGRVDATWVSGIACPNCMVEVFSDAGNEGGTFEGAVRANANGTFILTKPDGFKGPNLTATATGPNGLTSPFSSPVGK
jgi:titin